MKKAAVILGVITVLLFSQAAYAVDLQAGWYASVGTVSIEGLDWRDGVPYEWGVDYTFTTPAGSYGIFDVSKGDVWWKPIVATLTSDVYGILPGTLLEINGQFANSQHYTRIYAEWETDYDATKMQLQLIRKRQGQSTVLWSENRSGHQRHGSYIVPQLANELILPNDQLAFHIVAVPEPSSTASLVGLLLSAGVVFRSRRTH